ncbi:MAG: DUF1801 domain-containing protein [Cyclobacteriaceae bacterium]
MENVADYIQSFPLEIQKILTEMRTIIKDAVPPETEECISYKIPTYKLKGNLVHFAAFKNHIGFYPAPSGILNFEQRLEKYKYSKGTIRFPLDQDLPKEIIKEIVALRVKENLSKI